MTPRHRAEEFRRFLTLIDNSVPAHLDVHVVLDNSSTHRHRRSSAGSPPPALQLHFTLTYSSWLNLVERWFARADDEVDQSARPIARSATSSPRSAAGSPIGTTDPKPYVWHKTADETSTVLASTASGSTTQVTSVDALGRPLAVRLAPGNETSSAT